MRAPKTRQLPDDEEYRFPLSFAQQRLWFIEQLEQAGDAYHLRLPVRLVGALQVDALQAALDSVVARHEALRTRIVGTPDGPEQWIRPALDLELLDGRRRARQPSLAIATPWLRRSPNSRNCLSTLRAGH